MLWASSLDRSCADSPGSSSGMERHHTGKQRGSFKTPLSGHTKGWRDYRSSGESQTQGIQASCLWQDHLNRASIIQQMRAELLDGSSFVNLIGFLHQTALP